MSKFCSAIFYLSFNLCHSRTLPFDKLIHRCERTTNDEYFVAPDEHYYFRALGDNQRTDIANIE